MILLILFCVRSILEVEEENYSEKSETSSRMSNLLTVRHTEHNLQFKYDFTTINRIDDERRNSEVTYKLDIDQRETDSLLAFCPIEVFERNFLRNLQQKQREEEEQHRKENNFLKVDEPSSSSSSAFARIPLRHDDNTNVSNSLKVPVISLPTMEKPPVADCVYISDNMTIIDTDVPV